MNVLQLIFGHSPWQFSSLLMAYLAIAVSLAALMSVRIRHIACRAFLCAPISKTQTALHPKPRPYHPVSPSAKLVKRRNIPMITAWAHHRAISVPSPDQNLVPLQIESIQRDSVEPRDDGSPPTNPPSELIDYIAHNVAKKYTHSDKVCHRHYIDRLLCSRA